MAISKYDPKEPHFTLEELLAQVTDENIHPEFDLGSPVGKEVIEEAYLMDEDFEDTPDEKIESDLRQAWHEAMTGQTVPAKEALAAIRKTGKKNDDQR